MNWNAYHFVSRWHVGTDPDSAYAALYEVVDYPRWWPEVREARRLDDDHVFLRTRSLLPYEIAFTLAREIADPVARVLQARLLGDIEGTIRWSVESTMRGSVISWDQRVVARKSLLRRVAPLARPAFRVNHALMMRSGRSGLRRFLAGGRFGTGARRGPHTRSGGGAREG